MTYTAIGFDWGGVLNGKPNAFSWQPIADRIGVSVEDFQVAYFHHNQAFNRNEISARELWTAVLEELHQDIHDEELMEDILRLHNASSADDLNEDVVGLVKRLRQNGYKLGLLSNNTMSAAEHLRELHIDDLFDVFHVSAETGKVKPSPDAFTYLAAALGVPVHELIFIDDTPKSLSTAEKVGFTPILFTSYAQLVHDLEDLSIASA